MLSRDQWRAFEAKGWVQSVEFCIGVLLLIAAIPVGLLPGPGGIFVAAAGLALVLRTSIWAKRRYVRFKRWQPKAGRWFDWGLRRESARRRERRRKERIAQGDAPVHGDPAPGSLAALVPDPPQKPLGKLLKPGSGN